MIKESILDLNIIYGEIKLPNEYTLGTENILGSLLYNAFIEKNEVLNNRSFKINGSANLQWFQNYIIEFAYLKHKINLVTKDIYGIIQYPFESYINKERKANLDSGYTLLYGLDVEQPVKININIPYFSKRYFRKIKTNEFIIFPNVCDWIIEKNENKNLNSFLTSTYSA